MTSPSLHPDMEVSRGRQLIADGTLVLATLVWGSTFVLVKDVVGQVPPLLFLAARFMLGAVALAIMVTFARRWRGLSVQELVWGGLLGFFLWAGYAFQTIGLQWTTASNAGFITGLSVVLVPIFGIFLLHKAPDGWSWVGVVLATVGLALLSLHLEEGLRVNAGDLVVLGCAVAFAFHIVLISKFAWRADPLRLTLVQVVVAGVLNAVSSGLFEHPVSALGGEIWAATAFMGIVATALAFGAQVTVQRFTSAVHTALIFTLEPVFAAIFSVWLQGDRLGAAGLAGGALIVLGMVLAEVGPQIRLRVSGRAAHRHGHTTTDLQA